MSASLDLTLMSGTFAVCRLDPGAEVPTWSTAGPLASVTRTEGELSVLCSQEAVPDGVRSEGGWRAFEVAGPLDFSEVGILASMVGPLATEGVSVFVLSTFDTDYLLVREGELETARRTLQAAGHVVRRQAHSS